MNETVNESAEQERLFRHIYENSADAVVAVDPDGIVRFLNHAAEQLFDTPAEHLVGQLFKFQTYSDKPHEVRIVRPGKDTRVAEIRTTEIQFTGVKLFISSFHDVTELARLREELRAVEFSDKLTEVPDHHAFLILAQQQLKIAARTRRWLSLLLARVNHMKWINDAMGHLKGEQTLVDTANILKQTFRNSDIIARISEDEFAILTIEAHYSSSHLITERLLKNLEDYNLTEKKLYNLSLSLGTSFFDPEHPCSIDELLARARTTML